MKLRSVNFQFESGTVLWIAKGHEFEGKKYKYVVRVLRDGVDSTWHSAKTPNKTNSIRFMRNTKP